jgi:hypothetical protein
VKGTIMQPLVRGLKAGVPDARALVPPHLHRYLEERILVSEWYPEEDHLELLQILGRATGVVSFVPMGHVLAQFELGGVYKLALHKGDAVRTLRSWVKLWPLNHDTGALEITERRGGATYTLTDYAIPSREICEIVTGYVTEGLRMAIEKTPRVAHSKCRTTGAAACVWEIDLPAAATTTG